jgi:4-hydroxybenzoate polyprenyltransferase
MKIKAYIILIRIHHWLKNALVFLALIFSKNLFEADLFFKTLIGFFSFSLISSGVYIINDIFDAKKDKLHNI